MSNEPLKSARWPTTNRNHPRRQGPTYGYGKDGYSKDGKQIVAQPPVPTLQQKRWDVWAVGTGYLGTTTTSTVSVIAPVSSRLAFDYRVRPHWLVGVLADYTYTTGTLSGQNFHANTFRGAEGFAPLSELVTRVGGRVAGPTI